MGVLYVKYDLQDSLTAYKVRPALQDLPGRGESEPRPYETGKGNCEGVCGVVGASGGIVWVGPVPQKRWFATRWRRSTGLGRAWEGSHQELSDFLIEMAKGLDSQSILVFTPRNPAPKMGQVNMAVGSILC
jgi:hypothetical protein